MYVCTYEYIKAITCYCFSNNSELLLAAMKRSSGITGYGFETKLVLNLPVLKYYHIKPKFNVLHCQYSPWTLGNFHHFLLYLLKIKIKEMHLKRINWIVQKTDSKSKQGTEYTLHKETAFTEEMITLCDYSVEIPWEEMVYIETC